MTEPREQRHMTEAKDRQTDPLLSTRGVTKVFPGVRALDDIDFDLCGGEIHALMGENGAGKSTLINVLTGVLRADAGEVLLGQERVRFRSPHDAQQRGVATVYQEINLIPQLSVAENLLLGRQPTRFRMLRPREIGNRARAALERINVDINIHATLGTLSVAVQQMVAIARAVDMSSQVLVLDEPTSSLDADETRQLFGIMRDLRDRGMGLIFVTHFIDQVYDVSDRITVLRNGRHVTTSRADELPRLSLISHMIGREFDEAATQPPVRLIEEEQTETPYIRAKGVGRKHAIEPLDLEIRRGEVVGLAGLLGSGRTETARLLFGADRADTGTIEIDGETVRIGSPRDAIDRGVGFLAEDRKQDGILPELSLRDNMLLAAQAQRGVLRRIPAKAQRRIAQSHIDSLSIRTTGLEKPIRELSGGNQQKVLIARWLAIEPEVLLLDEPMRGVDVGARAEIEAIIRSLRERGVGVLMISSELDELVRSCDRVIVLRDRKHVAELRGEQITEANIMRHLAEHAA